MGEGVGGKEGGVVEEGLLNLEVRGRGENIGESMEVDMSELQVNERLGVCDIKMCGDLRMENNGEDCMVRVVRGRDEGCEEEVEGMQGE